MAERWQEHLIDFTAEWQDTEGWEKFSDWRQPDEASGYRRMAEERGFHVLHSKVLVDIDFCVNQHPSTVGFLFGILWLNDYG